MKIAALVVGAFSGAVCVFIAGMGIARGSFDAIDAASIAINVFFCILNVGRGLGETDE